MPAKKKSATPISRTRKAASEQHIVPLAPTHQQSHRICRSCHTLPVGSIELTALLLVLVFSLSAVLFTSVFALEMQKAKVADLQAQIQ